MDDRPRRDGGYRLSGLPDEHARLRLGQRRGPFHIDSDKRYRAEPARARRAVAINGTSLIATSATGSILWTYGFDEPLAEAAADAAGWRTQIVDLNADGLPEVLVTVAFASAPLHPTEILCFTSTGKPLWRYRPQVADLRFNKRDLNGPWHFEHVVVVPGRPTAIWAAVAHDVWWPSLVIRLSSRSALRTAAPTVRGMTPSKEKAAQAPLPDCPERKEKAVLRICDETGNWRTVAIPRLLPHE